MTRGAPSCELPGCEQLAPTDADGYPSFVNVYEQGRYSLAVCGRHWDAPMTGAAFQATDYAY